MTRIGKLSVREAKVWQAAQLEIVDQILALLPTKINIEGLLEDWQSILRHNPNPTAEATDYRDSGEVRANTKLPSELAKTAPKTTNKEGKK